jgi:hypothetical protein
MENEFEKIHEVINFFNRQFQAKNNRKCLTNRNKVRYLISNMLQDISLEKTKDLIRYYIETDKDPTLQKFCFEYDEIDEQKEASDCDKIRRISLLAETKKSVVEFRERYKN